MCGQVSSCKSNPAKRRLTQFTYTEKNGSKPIEEWLIPGLKQFAKTKYGISIEVYLKKEEKPNGKH